MIAQYPERYFPNARVVPNIIPIFEEIYTPVKKQVDSCVRLCYAPSIIDSAWHQPYWKTRWDTKGCAETEFLLSKLRNVHKNLKIDVIKNTPHRECLNIKRKADISIDEMVTGGFHLSSLESLSQGVPIFAYLDDRTQGVLKNLTGAETLPWMNFRVEEAAPALKYLINDKGLRVALGEESRCWVETYYNDCEMVGHFCKAYSDIVESPDTFNKDNELQKKGTVSIWYNRLSHDLAWEGRLENNRLRGRFKGVLVKAAQIKVLWYIVTEYVKHSTRSFGGGFWGPKKIKRIIGEVLSSRINKK